MAGSRGPEWAGIQELEDGIALVIGCQMTVDVVVEQARQVGHRRILAEAYRLEEEMEALRAWLAGVRSRLPLGENE
jgi:hypothetical protein